MVRVGSALVENSQRTLLLVITMRRSNQDNIQFMYIIPNGLR